MTPLCVIQARMGSSRLPGKVLADIAGMPALALQVRRVQQSAFDVVVATSDVPADDAVDQLARSLGVPVVRGPERDVLERYRITAEQFPAGDPIIRLTADCPLADPAIVRRAVEVHDDCGTHHTSNVLVRTFPDGFDVEVIRRTALLTAAVEATDPSEREHVTPFLMRRPRRFSLASVCSGVRAGLIRLTLDTVEDLGALRAAIARTGDPVRAAWNDLVDVPAPSTGISVWPRCAEGRMTDRRFVVLRDSSEIGEAVVVVDEGVGRLYLMVPIEAAAETRSWVERWLRLDKQVVVLA